MTQPKADSSADFAGWLVRQAIAGLTAGAALVLASVFVASTGTDGHPLSGALLFVATLAALAALGLSALIRFDAALFQLMFGKDETDAGTEIDRLLAGMRLKPMPTATRRLDDRITGARRLVVKQRLALALAAVAAAGAAASLWL